MRNILLVVVIAFTVSCTKAKVAPVYSIENTKWVVSGDTSYRFEFSTDSFYVYYPHITPNPSVAYYQKLTRDTVYVPAIDCKYVAVISKDSLLFTNTKNGLTMPLYRKH